MRRATTIVVLAGLAGLAVLVGLPAAASAQMPWAMVARRALGRIDQTLKPQTPTAPGYDIATVLVEAPADRVYARMAEYVRANPGVQVTGDPAQRRLDVQQGALRGSFSVSALGEHLSQIMVAEALAPGQPSDTSRVVARILAVCQALRQSCTGP